MEEKIEEKIENQIEIDRSNTVKNIQKFIRYNWNITLVLVVYSFGFGMLTLWKTCRNCDSIQLEGWPFYVVWFIQFFIAYAMHCNRNLHIQREKKFLIEISCLAGLDFIVALVPIILCARLPIMIDHKFGALSELGCQGTVVFFGTVVDVGITMICGAILIQTLSAFGKLKNIEIIIRTALIVSVIVAVVMVFGGFEYSSIRNVQVDNKPLTGFATLGWLAIVQCVVSVLMCCILMNFRNKKCATVGCVIAGFNVFLALCQFGLLIDPGLHFQSKILWQEIGGVDANNFLFGIKEEIVGVDLYSTISHTYQPAANTEFIAKMLNIVLVGLSSTIVILCKTHWNSKRQLENGTIQIPKSTLVLSVIHVVVSISVIVGMLYLFIINVEQALYVCEECDIEHPDIAIIEYRLAAIAMITQFVVALRICWKFLRCENYFDKIALKECLKENFIIGTASAVVLTVMAIAAPVGEVGCSLDSYLYYTYVREAKIMITGIGIGMIITNLVGVYQTYISEKGQRKYEGKR